MQKMYPCIFITQDEVVSLYGKPAVFKDNYVTTPSLYGTLENYLGIPIVSIQPAVREDDTIMVFYADGFIQYNPSSKRRIAAISGPAPYIMQAVTDIVKERTHIAPKVNPLDIINTYTFYTSPQERLELKDWVRSVYGGR